MATNISSFSQFISIDSRTRAGTIFLPSSFTIPGRVLTFKDNTGAFSTNFLTLTTNNANQNIDSTFTSTINRNPLGWQNFIAGNNNTWYTVGGTLINTVNTSTMNGLNINAQTISTGNLLLSTIGFRDQTYGSTYTLSVQSSLMYYNYAGVSTIIAGTRQSFGGLTLRMAAPFSPLQVSGLQLWLDAADVNTFTGGALWLDKSGTNNNGVNGTPGSTTMPSITKMNGLNAARFLIANANSVKTTNIIPAYTVTYFVVLRSTGGVAGQNFVFINNVDGQRQMEVRFTGTNTYPAELRYTTNSGGTGYLIISSVNQNQIILVCLTISASGTNLSSAYFNGSITANQTQTTTPSTPNSINYIGSANSASGYLSGDIGEILIYGQDLTTISGAPTQRQQVEGYLAWKWGLVANLPNNHPYKNNPP